MTHFHVGANVPGYLPEGDVHCAGSDADSAREALRGELDFSREAMPDCDYPTVDDSLCGRKDCDGCTGCQQIDDALSTLDTVDVFDGFSVDVFDGRALPVRHWIAMVPAADCEIASEE